MNTKDKSDSCVLVVKSDQGPGFFQQYLFAISHADWSDFTALPTQAIAGTIGRLAPLAELDAISAAGGDQIDFRQFRANPAFLEFLHEVLATLGPSTGAVRKAAIQVHNGGLAIIDLRTRHGPDDVPHADIIGMYRVVDGQVAGYQANRNYRLVTEDGIMQLPPPFAALHRKELIKLLPKRGILDTARRGGKALVRAVRERFLGPDHEDEF